MPLRRTSISPPSVKALAVALAATVRRNELHRRGSSYYGSTSIAAVLHGTGHGR